VIFLLYGVPVWGTDSVVNLCWQKSLRRAVKI